MNFFPLIFELSQFLKLSIIRSLIYVLIKYLIPVFNAYLTCESFDLYFFCFLFSKEEKKAFDRHTAKICQSLERYLNLKSKINDNTLQEVPTHYNHCQKKPTKSYIIKFVEHVYFEFL